jgi:predicted Ser/Thr protein kinase
MTEESTSQPSGDELPTTPMNPDDELQGLEPKNLIARGLESDAAKTATAGIAWEPPRVETLASSFPRHEIIKLLGRGGIGAVYMAKQNDLDRLVAIKVLPPHSSEDPQFAERFSREAKALAMLNHPHIVAIHDFGETDGMFYIVMEYVDGSDLRNAIKSGNITAPKALHLVPQICDALQYAHAKGLVHRDIKPENILLDSSGLVKVADFGLARLLGSETSELTLTATEHVMGTLKYMAPEQIEGAHDVDHRADIYSLGVVFYEMLTGELPIGRFPSPSEKSSLDERVDDVVFKTLEKEPAKRYQGAGEIKTDVENLANEPPVPGIDTPIAATPQPKSTSATTRSRISKKAVLGALWVLFTIPAVASLVFWFIPVNTVAAPGPPNPLFQALGPEHFGPSWIAIALGIGFLALGFSSVIGTLLLGALAIRDIRRSSGKIGGLRLALADVLLYPLLFIDIVLFFVVSLTTVFIVRFAFSGGANMAVILMVPILLLWLLLCAVIDFLIIRASWRRVRI